MTIRNLEFAVRPRSLAVVGASVKEGSVGRVVFDNIVDGGFEGAIWPVNPKYSEIGGRRCYPDAASLPEAPDLAVIATPPATVPQLVGEFGRKGTRAAVVITAGLNAANGLRQKMLDAARPYLFRIVGPNTLGLMIPPLKLNAGFAHIPAPAGGIALLSQSGAIATSLVDWAVESNLGFSHIVSLGDMADVDVADYLDMLAGDIHTRTILLYLESIPNPRKFMSAARAAARIKPVIAIKSGRHEQAAKAAATHTGALSGADRVVAAALERAGILRVNGLADLFDAAETTARFAPLKRSRVGIVTNGGGAGVLAVDQLVDIGGELAELAPATIEALDAALPPTWSHDNPVDIIGDAPPQRYGAAVAAVAADPGTDTVLVLNCPTGLASPVEAAAAVAALTQKGLVAGKPLLACWLGEHTAREGRRILQEAGVASFETPSDAASAVGYLSSWSRAQEALTRVPPASADAFSPDRASVHAILRAVAAEGRRMLTEPEAKEVISAYGIPVPQTIVAADPDAAGEAAGRLLQGAQRVVVKLMSKAISHKSDIGGVVLNITDAEEARDAAAAILKRVRKSRPDADVEGFAVQPMVVRRQAEELIVGMSRDPIFGPVILFGAGGTSVEVVDDTAIALPPIDAVLAGDLIDRTRIGRLLKGFRDRKPADRDAIITALDGVSRLIVDFPCIAGIDVNPLLADSDGVIALDARVEIDPEAVEEKGPNRALAIRPYPSDWEKEVKLAGGHHYLLRPIRPQDVRLYPDFFSKVSADDIRLRFLAPRKTFPADMLVRLTQLDYDRDMAFVALDGESGELAGIGRLSCDPDRTFGEYALLVRTDLQGRGLGWALLDRILDFARAEKVGRVEGIVLAENTKMLAMVQEFGFEVGPHPDEPGLFLVRIKLA